MSLQNEYEQKNHYSGKYPDGIVVQDAGMKAAEDLPQPDKALSYKVVYVKASLFCLSVKSGQPSEFQKAFIELGSGEGELVLKRFPSHKTFRSPELPGIAYQVNQDSQYDGNKHKDAHQGTVPAAGVFKYS